MVHSQIHPAYRPKNSFNEKFAWKNGLFHSISENNARIHRPHVQLIVRWYLCPCIRDDLFGVQEKLVNTQKQNWMAKTDVWSWNSVTNWSIPLGFSNLYQNFNPGTHFHSRIYNISDSIWIHATVSLSNLNVLYILGCKLTSFRCEMSCYMMSGAYFLRKLVLELTF